MDRLDEKSLTMLELLARGASSKEMARHMGYVDGTMRVYLHNLYRRLGVANKTAAVIWYLERHRRGALAAAPVAPERTAPGEASFGDAALRDGLGAALGCMGLFLGPYGRVWEVASRMKGQAIDAAIDARRARARRLWRALLDGEFACGKRAYDDDEGATLLADHPHGAVLLGLLLALGGYSAAASRIAAKLARLHQRGQGVSARECALLAAAAHAATRGGAALANLHQLAAHATTPLAVRQAALVGLFHVHCARRDPERARRAANAVWTAAEVARRELEAMGDRYFGRDDTLLPPERGGRASLGAHETAAAGS